MIDLLVKIVIVAVLYLGIGFLCLFFARANSRPKPLSTPLTWFIVLGWPLWLILVFLAI